MVRFNPWNIYYLQSADISSSHLEQF